MSKKVMRIVAIKYKCPRCAREHQKGVSGDWYEDNTRNCSYCGVPMWHEAVKKEVKPEEPKPTTSA